MKHATYLLVIVSAFSHAYWNFIFKQSKGAEVFIGLSKVAEVLLFFVPFVYVVSSSEASLSDHWPFCVVGALIAVPSYLFMDKAYQSGDLSVIYPISRSGALVFLPALAYLFVGETIDAHGGVAILLILAGLFTIQLSSFDPRGLKLALSKLKNPSTLYALLASLMVACIYLWDKHAVRFISPFLYFYAYTAFAGAFFALFILVRHPLRSIRSEWSAHKLSIVQVGFLNTFGYVLTLLSLQAGKASYVIALRQLSIAFSAFLGWQLLRELFPLPKKVGMALLLAGCLLISLAG